MVVAWRPVVAAAAAAAVAPLLPRCPRCCLGSPWALLLSLNARLRRASSLLYCCWALSGPSPRLWTESRQQASSGAGGGGRPQGRLPCVSVGGMWGWVGLVSMRRVRQAASKSKQINKTTTANEARKLPADDADRSRLCSPRRLLNRWAGALSNAQNQAGTTSDRRGVPICRCLRPLPPPPNLHPNPPKGPLQVGAWTKKRGACLVDPKTTPRSHSNDASPTLLACCACPNF